MARKYIVYLTTNTTDGRYYIGIHLNKKEDPHELDNYYGSNKELKADIRKLGRENFTRDTLFIYNTKEEAKTKEKELVTPEVVNDPNTYNKTTGGGGYPDMTEGIKQKIRVANSGENCYMFGKHPSEETREKLREMNGGLNNGFYGKSHTQNTRQKMSKNHADVSGSNNPMKGRHHTEEARKKMRVNHKDNRGENHGMFGKQRTDEWKKNHSERMSGLNNPQYGKRGEDTPRFGIYHTEETKQLMRENSGKKLSLEVIKQRREDIKNVEKVRGWKTKLAIEWGKCSGAVTYFVKKYASDLAICNGK